MSAPDWFVTPGPEFRPAAFWFWHAIPSEAEMLCQLADMAATGLSRVMIQARLALPLESYLSPAWRAACRFASAEAMRLGLKLSIYDEYMWMSGHGGGRTVDGADHLRERHLFWASGPAENGRARLTISNPNSSFLDFLGPAGRDWIYEGGAPLWGDWQLVAAVRHPDAPADLSGIAAAPARIVSADAHGCTIEVDLPDDFTPGSTVTAFVAARCTASRLINYLLPEAAERFAETVYAPLLAAAGGAADVFFFDHPYAGFCTWEEHAGDLGNSLLWDDALPTLFDDTAPFAARLLSLTRDVGPQTASLRAGFFKAYGDRLHESFFGTLSRWAKSNGCGFTGHELLTHVGAWGLFDGLGGFDPRSMPGVDYFGIDAYRTSTTVDAADYAPQLSAKFGDSVARAHGRHRCTIEQYATGRETGTAGLAGQWGLTLERFRAQAIRHLLFGARQILLHAYTASDGFDDDPRLGANPRFDFPPGFNFEPWWEDCPGVFAELARLSAFLEDGTPLRPVALFYPLETIRAEAMTPACGKHFGWWAEALARAGLGYDILDERQLGSLAASAYATLILPAATTLADTADADTIARWIEAGGTLLASGPLPSKTRADGAAPDLETVWRDAALTGRLLHLPDADQPAIAQAVAALPRPRPTLRLDDGPSWNAIARCGDTWRIAAFNDEDCARTLAITIENDAADVTRWDPERGTTEPLPDRVRDGLLTLALPAHGLVCLSIRTIVEPDNRAVAPAAHSQATSLAEAPTPRRTEPQQDADATPATAGAAAVTGAGASAGAVAARPSAASAGVVAAGTGAAAARAVGTGADAPDRAGARAILRTATRPLPSAGSDAPAARSIRLADGWTFELRGTGVVQPIAVDRGWEVQGFPTFAGTGLYRCPLALPSLPAGFGWHLVLPGLCETAECHVDGHRLGRQVAGEARFPLPPTAKQLELHIRNTAANRYYAGTPYWNGTPQPSGLTAVPRLEAVHDGVS